MRKKSAKKSDKKINLKALGIAGATIVGLFLFLIAIVAFMLKDYDVSFVEDTMIIAQKTEVAGKTVIEPVGEITLNSINKLDDLKEIFSLKNNIVSIVILIIGVTLYIIAKRRNDYVEREKD